MLMFVCVVPPDAVTIDGSPQNEVLLATPYNLTCRATGAKPAPTIVWQSGGVTLTDGVVNSVVSEADGKRQDVTSWLLVTPSKADQGRSYTCSAQNAAMMSAVTARTTLDVLCKSIHSLESISGASPTSWSD